MFRPVFAQVKAEGGSCPPYTVVNHVLAFAVCQWVQVSACHLVHRQATVLHTSTKLLVELGMWRSEKQLVSTY